MAQDSSRKSAISNGTSEKKMSATSTQVKTYEELVSFLAHPRPELRKSASSLLIGITATDQGIHQLLQLKQIDIIKALCRVVSDLRPIAEDAIKALINLTAANPVACERALKSDLLNRVFNQLEDDDWRLKDYSMMLLANVTTTPEGTKSLLGYDEKNANAHVVYREKKIRTLTSLFLENVPEPEGVDKQSGEAKWDDDYQYVANILANISQLEEGRQFLLKHRHHNTLVAELLPQLRSPNVIRRRGIAALVRNLCFDTDHHFFLYDQLDVVSQMMYVLAGPEPLGEDEKKGMHPSVYRLGEKKKREIDQQVRLAAVECLLLLCTTRNGRNDLRKKKVYPIVRNAHLVEQVEEIGDQIYKLVDFLIRDEEGEEPDWNTIRAQAFTDDTKKDQAETLSKEKPNPTTEKETESAHVQVEEVNKKYSVPVQREQQVEDEIVSDDIAVQLANEINLLDVSSDEEDKDLDIQ
jgi:hypothetical protein